MKILFNFWKVRKGSERKLNRPQPKPTAGGTLNRAGAVTVVTRIVCLGFALMICGSALAKERPYKGGACGEVIESVYIATPAADGVAFLKENARAEGNFTHLGKAKVELSWEVSAVAVDGHLMYLTTGAFQVTGANGDEMHGLFESWQSSLGGEARIQVTVQGGSGKFRNARGIIPGVGEKDGANFCYTLDGVLDY